MGQELGPLLQCSNGVAISVGQGCIRFKAGKSTPSSRVWLLSGFNTLFAVVQRLSSVLSHVELSIVAAQRMATCFIRVSKRKKPKTECASKIEVKNFRSNLQCDIPLLLLYSVHFKHHYVQPTLKGKELYKSMNISR